MRFPWQRRADEEQQHRIVAEKRRDDANSDWPVVREHAARLRREKDLNGWTDTIVGIFGTTSGKGT